jgi:hypothetical protein
MTYKEKMSFTMAHMELSQGRNTTFQFVSTSKRSRMSPEDGRRAQPDRAHNLLTRQAAWIRRRG